MAFFDLEALFVSTQQLLPQKMWQENHRICDKKIKEYVTEKSQKILLIL
jgi:hypothetical protein